MDWVGKEVEGAVYSVNQFWFSDESNIDAAPGLCVHGRQVHVKLLLREKGSDDGDGT